MLKPLYSKGGARLHLGETGGHIRRGVSKWRHFQDLCGLWCRFGRAAAVMRILRRCTVTGRGPESAGLVIGADPNVLYPNSSIPSVSYRIRKGEAVRLETEIETYYQL